MNKKTLIFVLTLFLTMFIVGCTDNTPKTLDTPDIMIQGNVVSWSSVENAESYELHIGTNVYTLETTWL